MITRQKSFLATASAIAALTLAACGGGGGGDAAGDLPTLNRGISAKVDTLDPHRSSAAGWLHGDQPRDGHHASAGDRIVALRLRLFLFRLAANSGRRRRERGLVVVRGADG